jgi:predicted nicotinamide N-methyase
MTKSKAWYMAETPEDAIGEVKISDVDVGNGMMKIARPAFPDRLLDLESVHAAFEKDEYMPYWATLWPVAKFLASEILTRSWPAGLSAIEIGCGLGLPGIAAMKRGVDVLFTDYDETALKFARTNCSLNGFYGIRTALLDWREPHDSTYDIVIASDLIYERRNVEPVIAMLSSMLAPGGTALVADQDRSYRENFLALLGAAGFSWTMVSKNFLNHEGQPVTGSVYTITRVPG